MSTIVTLPSGATVTLHDPLTFKQKDRRKLLVGLTAEQSLAEGLSLIDNAMALIIADWSFDLIIPSVKIDSLGELDIPDYDALQEHAQATLDLMFPNLGKPADGVVDPKVTTAE